MTPSSVTFSLMMIFPTLVLFRPISEGRKAPGESTLSFAIVRPKIRHATPQCPRVPALNPYAEEGSFHYSTGLERVVGLLLVTTIERVLVADQRRSRFGAPRQLQGSTHSGHRQRSAGPEDETDAGPENHRAVAARTAEAISARLRSVQPRRLAASCWRLCPAVGCRW